MAHPQLPQSEDNTDTTRFIFGLSHKKTAMGKISCFPQITASLSAFCQPSCAHSPTGALTSQKECPEKGFTSTSSGVSDLGQNSSAFGLTYYRAPSKNNNQNKTEEPRKSSNPRIWIQWVLPMIVHPQFIPSIPELDVGNSVICRKGKNLCP